MIKYCLAKWDANKEFLRGCVSSIENLHEYEYTDLVKLVVDYVFNVDCFGSNNDWNAEGITTIDDGSYQGTLLFLIPKNTSQPDEYEYLMTFASYGSCSGCDTLQSIQREVEPDQMPSEEVIDEIMMLCKDIVCNTIKPYNNGWRHEDCFDSVEEG